MRSKIVWKYPSSIKGNNSHVEIAELDCPCPPLFSVEGMRDLWIVLDFNEEKIRVKTLGIEGMEMRMAPSGHPLLPLTDFTDTSHIPDDFLTFYAEEELSEEETSELNYNSQLNYTDEEDELALFAETTHRMPIKNGVQKRLKKIASGLQEVVNTARKAVGTVAHNKDFKMMELFTCVAMLTTVALTTDGWTAS